MKFHKGTFYKHVNCKDIIIYVLWVGKFSDYYKLKIEYWNISLDPSKELPIGIGDRVKIKLKDVKNWKRYLENNKSY